MPGHGALSPFHFLGVPPEFPAASREIKIRKVKARKVKLAAKEASVEIGSKYNLKPKVVFVATGSTIADEALTFKSSDKSVATVSKKGVVTGVKAGTATITATAKRLGQKATCKITVTAPEPTKVRLYKDSKKLKSKQELKLKKGDTLKLKAKLSPTNAESKLTWTSSDPKVATVSKSGVVKALKKGKTTITVKTKRGGKKFSVVIKVVKK